MPGAGASTRSHLADKAHLTHKGYAIVRRLFAVDEIERLRTVAVEAMAELERHGLVAGESGREGTTRVSNCDLLSIPSVRTVLLDRRLIGVVGELLGGRPSYFGDSSLRIGMTGSRAWHRDNVDRIRRRGGPDWRDPYPLLRCGLYLQDQSRCSGGLAVRPRSNRPERKLPTLAKLVDAEAGDLVAWDLRTVHSGEAVRPRKAPWLALNPKLQTRLPTGMRVSEERRRIVMFMTFGLAGEHLDNLVAYFKTRDYMQELWRGSRFQPEVLDEAEAAGLNVIRPIPEYGAPAPLDTAEPRSASV